MKLGLNIRNYGPTATPDNLRAWTRFAEDSGFTLGVVSDHVAPTPEVNELYPSPFYDPLTALSWFAGITERLELGTSVLIAPYRHPLLTARLAASIDRLSDGRLILGVGAGWSEQEFAALGLPFRRRGRMTDEYLAAISAAWSQDRVSLDGEFVHYDDVHTGPGLVGSRRPPIWVGGTSPGALRRAARFGDAWHPNNAELDWIRDVGLPSLREAAESFGRPVPALSPRMRAHVSERPIPDDERRPGSGSPDQIVADVETLVELGADYVVLDTNPDHPRDERPLSDDWRDLEAIATRVFKRLL
ncbi:TIGR03619 family F420-dependent LLM class oxidoreductase [Phytoactinopolyspora halotolerans]|uniref:TIGR03619 family F420-dependent LLM class oxidoreductase n=1 Tax=Phytoactinopolyspora halotolerans TaxID=1981512 RepID=A0A6L9SBH3_9ACTN|nr:TIGR03619 family F420-dependent LLM class oxidoreductase [Phytoactinopolyspora halotolerans]